MTTTQLTVFLRLETTRTIETPLNNPLSPCSLYKNWIVSLIVKVVFLLPFANPEFVASEDVIGLELLLVMSCPPSNSFVKFSDTNPLVCILLLVTSNG